MSARVPDDDRVWALGAARGTIDSPGALEYVRSLNALGLEQVRAIDPELAQALEGGNREHAGDDRRQPGPDAGPPPVDVDPATMAALDRQTARRRPHLRAVGPDEHDGLELLPVNGDPTIAYTLEAGQAGIYSVAKRAPILDWCPRVLERLVRLGDDGRPAELQYVLEVGEPVVQLTVLYDDLLTGACWNRAPDVTGVGRKVVREQLANVVLEQASALPPTWLVHRCGWWRTPEGVWAYVRTPDPVRHVRPSYQRGDIARAYEPVGVVTLSEVVRALEAIAGHGWGPILGLATGLRALAQAIRPVRSSLVAAGDPNTGKTLTAAMATAVVMTPRHPDGSYWPPLADASFSDTPPALEVKVREVADRALVLDDMPLTSESTPGEDREANQKFDRVIRAVANNQPVRDKLNRDSTMREPTWVRGLPVITAQKLPARVQASALRRIVLADFRHGDNDWRWYRDHAAGEVYVPVRALGERVIRALEQLGPERAREAVTTADDIAGAQLAEAYRARVSDDVPGMDGVLTAAGQMLGGLMLAELVAEVPVHELLEAVVPPLADSLAHQAGRIGDRQAVDTGAGEAIGEVLRAAYYARRAHVREQGDDMPRASIPGQTHQAQGITAPGDPGPVGLGVGTYWLPDRQAVGVTTTDLHTLVRAARDVRLQGFTPVSLAKYLRREGVSIPGRQSGADATELVRIGARAEGRRKRLVMLPVGVIFDEPDDEPDTLEPTPAPAPELPPEPEVPGAPELPLEPASSSPAEVPASSPDGALCGPLPADGGEHQPERREAGRRAHSGRSGAPGGTPRGAVLVVDGGRLALPGPGGGREWRALEGGAAGDLAELVAEVDRAVPAGPVTVLVAEGDHRGYGLAKRAPRDAARLPVAFRPLREAGWHRPGHPAQPPLVTRSAALAREGREGAVRVLPVAWLGPDDFPRWRGEGVDQADALELAVRLEQFAEVTGWPLEGTVPATGVRMLRDMLEATARRPIRWQAEHRRSWPTPHQSDTWRRELTAGETGASHVHTWDGVRHYLAAYGQACIAGDELRHREAPPFDPGEAGYWLAVVPAMPEARVPAPVAAAPGSSTWVTTAVLELWAELGLHPEVLEAWTAPRVQLEGLRRFTAHVRDVLEAGAPAPVAAAVKHLYQSTHGKLRDGRQAVIGRPDWGHAVRDAAWCSTLRKAWQAAGLLPLPKRMTGGLRTFTTEPRWPVAVVTDAIAYAGGAEAVAPAGLEVGDQLGRFRFASSVTIAEWREGER